MRDAYRTEIFAVSFSNSVAFHISHRAQLHSSTLIPTQASPIEMITLFSSVHRLTESTPFSLPIPLPFVPPNGISAPPEGEVQLTPTTPASRAFAHRRARSMFFVKTDAYNPSVVLEN